MANPTSLVAKPFLDEIIKTTLALIKETYSSIRGVKKDVENLSSTLTAIKGVLVDADNKQENNQQLKDWLGKLKEAAFDAEDILETFAAEAYHWKRRQTAVKENELCNFSEQSRHVSLLGKDVQEPLSKIVNRATKLRSLLLPESIEANSSGHLKNFGQAFQRVGHEKGYEIEQLAKMSHLSGTLHISKLEKAVNARDAKLNEKKSLDKLVFEWSDGVVNTQDEATENSLLADLQPHSSNLKELQIIRYRGNEFPAWMKQGRLQNLVRLTLNGCIKCETLALGKLPHLQVLHIKGMLELKILTEVECRFLRWLKLINCPKLRELPIIFPFLQVLKIKRCDSLRALPVLPFLKLLILIKNPILEDWNEKTLELEDCYDGHDPSFNEIRDLPSIGFSRLKVISCPKLQALPQLFAPQKLEISRCELLTTLPPHARRLWHLAVDGCDDGAIVREIPDSSSLYSLVISSISNISSLPKWPQLPGLKALYIRDCKHLVSLSSGEEGSLRTLTSLNLLSIINCEKLETLNEELPTSLECLTIASCPLLKSFSLKNIPSLSDLYIEDCPMLQSLPGDGLPSSLKHLQIQTCPLLTQRCKKEGGGGPDWPKIEHIPDLEIDNSHMLIPSTSLANSPVPSTSVANRPVWYRHFLCCRALEKEMVKMAATDLNKAESEEIFLDHKTKKKWADEKTGHICFMFYARSLTINWSHREYWIWNCFKETSDENIEVAKLSHVCWLEVNGKLSTSELSPEVVYEIVYVVKLTKGASGWELPIRLNLTLPDGRVQRRQISLLEKPRRQWIELNFGNFQTKNGESGEVGFQCIGSEGRYWKHGLIIKGAIIRPKQATL
ncbi:hypothetical protein FH972_009874 [Carpinus fangiana]|uniref:Uncharacterized protein n=1 Tax=Carpinus fangiana TaxID=176857 RepID=A0A660KLL4_9ROSI|nr:hypothetical protein FH972_009874 [Carpinus fangiana]